MSIYSRTGSLAAVLALTACAASAPTYTGNAGVPSIIMPKSARGNGARGHPNHKRRDSRDLKARRRKLAKASQRRNRR